MAVRCRNKYHSKTKQKFDTISKLDGKKCFLRSTWFFLSNCALASRKSFLRSIL